MGSGYQEGVTETPAIDAYRPFLVHFHNRSHDQAGLEEMDLTSIWLFLSSYISLSKILALDHPPQAWYPSMCLNICQSLNIPVRSPRIPVSRNLIADSVSAILVCLVCGLVRFLVRK